MLIDAMDTPNDRTPVPLQLVQSSRFSGVPNAAAKPAIFGVQFRSLPFPL